MTQCGKVLRHMREYGSITSLEAMTEYGIMRLSGRIFELKEMGYNISSETTTGKNRYGEPVHFTTYRLEAVQC